VCRFATRLEISDHDLGCTPPGFDFGDLSGESGGRKRRILARTHMIECPSDAHVKAIVHRQEGEPFLRELAQSVWIGGLDGSVFCDGLLRRTIDHRGARNEHDTRRRYGPQRLEEMMRAPDVHFRMWASCGPRHVQHVRSGAVIDGAGRSREIRSLTPLDRAGPPLPHRTRSDTIGTVRPGRCQATISVPPARSRSIKWLRRIRGASDEDRVRMRLVWTSNGFSRSQEGTRRSRNNSVQYPFVLFVFFFVSR